MEVKITGPNAIHPEAEPAFDRLLFSAVVCGSGWSSSAFPSEHKGVIVLAGRQGSARGGETTKLGDPPVTRAHWHEPRFDAFWPKCTAPKAATRKTGRKKKKKKPFNVPSMVPRFIPLGEPVGL